MKHLNKLAILCSILLVVLVWEVRGQYEGDLGTVDFETSCAAEVQKTFNTGLLLLHHMMYEDAEETFARVAKQDPNCAMAYWGTAMTVFHPLWPDQPTRENLAKGTSAVEKAKALQTTDREKAYIQAVEAFYKDWKQTNDPARIQAWADAQEEVYKKYPDDVDAAAFYALSHLATAPKDDKTFKHQQTAGKLLEKFYTQAPEHPGLIHYTIHAYDNPNLSERGVNAAHSYDKIAPNVPHATHMPSHIFVRRGMWSEVVDWNLRSLKSSKQHVGKTSEHYIHAADYLVYAYMQQGQAEKVKDLLEQINRVDGYVDHFTNAYGLAAMQARYPLEQKAWKEAAALETRPRSFPWHKYPETEAMVYFARGLGAARTGDAAAAQQAIDTLDVLYQRTVDAGQDYWAVHLDAQRKAVAAWQALVNNQPEKALQLMRQAADLEDSVDKSPVTPGAVLPARELLGDMLLEVDQPKEALKAYRASMEVSPNRFNGLYGAGYAAERAGDAETAQSYYTQLMEIAPEVQDQRPELKHARSFLETTETR